MIRLAGPLVLDELGWMAMGVADTMFVGRVSAEAIGAVGLGTMVFYGISVCSGGLLLGLDTLVARAFGAGDRDDCHRSLVSGVWLAVLMIPWVMSAVLALEIILPNLGVDRVVLSATRPYLHALIWSAPPLMLYFALRRYLQALHIARPVMITLLTANLVNLAGNWVLVLGHLGAPRLGAQGAGWATCFSRIYMAAALAYILLGKLCRKPVSRMYAHRYRLYLNRRDMRRQAHLVKQIRGRKFISGPEGEQHNLDEVFERLNAQFFDNLLGRPQLGWSRKPSRSMLGHFDPSHNAIIISRIFDQPPVPGLALDYVMYHEMLHLRFPVDHRGARRCVHTQEFREAEKRFPQWKEAKEILKRL